MDGLVEQQQPNEFNYNFTLISLQQSFTLVCVADSQHRYIAFGNLSRSLKYQPFKL